MTYMTNLGIQAKHAAKHIRMLTQSQKNRGLLAVAEELRRNMSHIIEANQKDIQHAHEKNMNEALIDRLTLDESRIQSMADGLIQIADLDDPIGRIEEMVVRPNGLQIGKKRVPLGIVGIIYESRPNVTADAFGLCFKTGNTTILRGGSDAICSNKAIVSIIRNTLKQAELSEDAVLLVEDTSRQVADEMMKMNGYLDVLIPRGGKGLIQAVVKNSTVPVIETGTGNCHVYVDEYADLTMAVDIIENAKTQRLGVCNACESLVIHSNVAHQVIPMIYQRLTAKGVAIRGDKRAVAIQDGIVSAAKEDWYTEYLDAIISVKVVDTIDEAINHINECNTGHSESIITDNYQHALRFQEEIDAAAVYVNASTRFTDGFKFGFGAEIGISTQKLHARGPMGLLALTTTKYIIFGNGQVRS